MSNKHAAPPAGWYRDPMGLPQLRFWNGQAWTNQVHTTDSHVLAA